MLFRTEIGGEIPRRGAVEIRRMLGAKGQIYDGGEFVSRFDARFGRPWTPCDRTTASVGPLLISVGGVVPNVGAALSRRGNEVRFIARHGDDPLSKGVNLNGMGGGVNGPGTFYDYLRSETIGRPLK